MAEVITRFKLETTQYDSALRDAGRSLSDFAKEARQAGNEFSRFTQDNVEAARSFGGIATSANNAKDQLKELVNAYNDVAKAYDQLTQEQQQSDFGKAMADSLQQLSGRIADAKDKLYSMGEQGKETGGIFDAFKDKLTFNVDALKLLEVGLGAVDSVLGVVKDAFFNNEQQLDEWGRICESSESLYNGFLNALNTGDISGYLSNINTIIVAARNAYDALDELQTFNAFNQINVQKARRGMTEAIVDYREGNLSKEEVKTAFDAYKKELEERQRKERNAYEAAVAQKAAERGVNRLDFMAALSGTYGKYKELKAVMPTRSEEKYVPGGPGQPGRYDTFYYPQNYQERLGQALRNFNDTELQDLQALGAKAEQTRDEIANVDKQLLRVLSRKPIGDVLNPQSSVPNRRGSGGGGRVGRATSAVAAKVEEVVPVGSIADYQNQIRDLQKQQSLATDTTTWKALEQQIQNVTNRIKELKGEIPTLAEEMAQKKKALENPDFSDLDAFARSMTLQMNEDFQQKAEDAAKAQQEAARKTASAWQLATQSIQNVGGALQALENPGAKVAGIIAEAVAQIALGFAMASAKTGATTGVFGWIAAATGGLATMISTISAVKSATKYAEGGMIRGTSYSGDNIVMPVEGGGFASLNAGEVVLNRSQQSNLANALQGGGIGNLNLTATVSGEQIQLVLNNRGRRTGRGEYVQAKFR